MGDLPGVLSRLDHLAWLGVDAVWLSPVYPSPMLDGGYDIVDFTGIDPVFGTQDDFDRLVGSSSRLPQRCHDSFVMPAGAALTSAFDEVRRVALETGGRGRRRSACGA